MKPSVSLSFITAAVSAFAFSGQANAKIESPDKSSFQNEVDALLALPEANHEIALNYWNLEHSLGDAQSLKELYDMDGLMVAYNSDSSTSGNYSCYGACYGNCYSNCYSACYSNCNG